MIDFNNLSSGWIKTNVEEIAIKISNGTTQKQNKENLGLPVTRIETISQGYINFNKVGYVKEFTPDFIEKYRLRRGDILFSNINSDLHLGKTAIFNEENKILIHGMNLLIIRVNPQIIVSAFFHYLCNYYRFSG